MREGSEEFVENFTEPTGESPATPPLPSRLRRVGGELALWLRTLASAAVYATLIVTFGFQVARVEGRSMEPTLHDQDRLIVNKLAYHVDDPQVGDVVMLLHPNNPDQSLVKRVVAAPGDSVAFREGVVVRNGIVADEGFIPVDHRSFEDRAPVVVPEGYYFVLGDHRNNSSDSRTFGPVPKKYILGRIQVRWWPFAEARSFEP
jgi:signal peptidase I